MNIVSIDPSLNHTGVFTRINGSLDAEVFEPTGKDRVKKLAQILIHFVAYAKGGFDLCLIEGYDPGAKGQQGVIQGEVGGIIRACFEARGVPVVEVPIPTWKSITGIALKKGTRMADSDYLNAVATKYKIRLQTSHEADAYLIFQCVRMSARKLLPQVGAQNIRHRLEDLKIDLETL